MPKGFSQALSVGSLDLIAFAVGGALLEKVAHSKKDFKKFKADFKKAQKSETSHNGLYRWLSAKLALGVSARAVSAFEAGAALVQRVGLTSVLLTTAGASSLLSGFYAGFCAVESHRKGQKISQKINPWTLLEQATQKVMNNALGHEKRTRTEAEIKRLRNRLVSLYQALDNRPDLIALEENSALVLRQAKALIIRLGIPKLEQSVADEHTIHLIDKQIAKAKVIKQEKGQAVYKSVAHFMTAAAFFSAPVLPLAITFGVLAGALFAKVQALKATKFLNKRWLKEDHKLVLEALAVQLIGRDPEFTRLYKRQKDLQSSLVRDWSDRGLSREQALEKLGDDVRNYLIDHVVREAKNRSPDVVLDEWYSDTGKQQILDEYAETHAEAAGEFLRDVQARKSETVYLVKPPVTSAPFAEVSADSISTKNPLYSLSKSA